MRSRPQLGLEVWPQLPRAGERLNYRLTLHSRTDTPVDAVRVRFKGIEESGSNEDVVRHDHCDLEEDFGGRPLAGRVGTDRTSPRKHRRGGAARQCGSATARSARGHQAATARAELLWRTLQRLAQALLSPTAQPG